MVEEIGKIIAQHGAKYGTQEAEVLANLAEHLHLYMQLNTAVATMMVQLGCDMDSGIKNSEGIAKTILKTLAGSVGLMSRPDAINDLFVELGKIELIFKKNLSGADNAKPVLH